MKYIIIMLALFLSVKTLHAQQLLKTSLKDKKDKFVQITTINTSIYVEGYDGDEIIIEPYHGVVIPKSIPGEALGFKNITALTNRVNPGISGKMKPSAFELQQVINITVPESNYKALSIKIPKNTHLKLQYVNQAPDITVSLNNLSGELELNGAAYLTEINNISGPLTLSSRSTLRSKIKISNIKWKPTGLDKAKFLLYLSSPVNDFDIAIPEDLKATFEISAGHGNIYSDLNLVRKFPESNSLNYFQGDLNGGGVNVVVIAEYGNVFIRKQK